MRDDVFRWLDLRRNAGAYEYSRDELVNYAFNGVRERAKGRITRGGCAQCGSEAA